MKALKFLFVVLCVLLLALSPVFSQSYYVTEEQLQKLETELKTQRQLVQKQKEQLETLQNQLNEAEKSLTKSESRNLTEKILIGVSSGVAGVVIGGIIGGIIGEGRK